MKTNTKDIFIDTASSLFANQVRFIIIFPKEKNNLLKKLYKKLLKKFLQKF